MKKFLVRPSSELSEQDFDEWPVWSEHYDSDELDDVEGWGLDREEVSALFQENERGNEHCVYTLLEANPFPARMRIFIRASLELANGQLLKGYVMNEDAYCLAAFNNGQEFIFSSNSMLDGSNREEEQNLRRSLGIQESTTVFPIRYQTEYRTADGTAISGLFRYGARAA